MNYIEEKIAEFRKEFACTCERNCGELSPDMNHVTEVESFLSTALSDLITKYEEAIPREITKEEKDRDPYNIKRNHEIMGYETCRNAALSNLQSLRTTKK